MITCPGDEHWPQTIHNTPNVRVRCPRGYSGWMYRDCDGEGVWGAVRDEQCSRGNRVS